MARLDQGDAFADREEEGEERPVSEGGPYGELETGQILGRKAHSLKAVPQGWG